jgi:selenium metabolism protein YedF
MEHKVDARGLACPQPVIKTRKMLEEFPDGNFLVIVDNENSRDNVMRMLANRGYESTSDTKGTDFVIHVGSSTNKELHNKELEPAEVSCDTGTGTRNCVIYLKSNQMGVGDEKLGSILIRGFLQTLKDISPIPTTIVCVNSGVFLTTENEDTINALKELETLGVTVLSCGTCLDFYEVKDKLAVGKISNMLEIAETLCNADNVVSP